MANKAILIIKCILLKKLSSGYVHYTFNTSNIKSWFPAIMCVTATVSKAEVMGNRHWNLRALGIVQHRYSCYGLVYCRVTNIHCIMCRLSTAHLQPVPVTFSINWHNVLIKGMGGGEWTDRFRE